MTFGISVAVAISGDLDETVSQLERDLGVRGCRRGPGRRAAV